MFWIEQIIYINMDSALNNLQRLICHKTQQTKPSLSLSLYIYIYIYIYIYQLLCSCRMRHNVNSTSGLTGLNKEFSYSLTSCHTKAKELRLPYNLPTPGGRIVGFIPFQRWNEEKVRLGFELRSPYPLSWTISITPQWLPNIASMILS